MRSADEQIEALLRGGVGEWAAEQLDTPGDIDDRDFFDFVSVTVDDRRHLDEVVAALSEFAEVACEHDMAIVCAVGEGLRTEPSLLSDVLHAVGDVPVRLLSQAASRRNITFVIREADVPTALGRLHEHFFATTTAGAAA